MKIDRVLYVLPRQDYFLEGPCGRVTHAFGVIEGLVENGVSVTVITGRIDNSIMPGLSSRVVFYHVDGDEQGVHPFASGSWTSRLLKSFAKILMDSPPFDLVLVRYSVKTCHRVLPIMRKQKNLCWGFEINSLAYNHLRRWPYILRRLIRAREVRILSKTAFVYVVSRRLKDDLEFLRPQLRRDIIVCPNAGPSSLCGRPRCAPSNGVTRFAYLGVFHHYYELELLLDTFKEIHATFGSAVELCLFGYGAQYSRMHSLASAEEGVYLYGRYCIDNLIREGVIDESMVLVLPYSGRGARRSSAVPLVGVTDFTSPVKLFEYMALGLPIIASCVGQITEVLEDGITAKMYVPGDRTSLFNAMAWMVENREARLGLGRQANRVYREAHTWKVRMKYLLERLSSLTACGGDDSGRDGRSDIATTGSFLGRVPK